MKKIIKKIIVFPLDLIMFLFKPRIFKVNSREEAEFWATYGGGEIIKTKQK